LATTSFITVPAVVAITSNADANQSLHLVHRRINMMTAICGTVSVTTLSLAFLFGSKHGYLVYAGATSAILLRNQRQTIQEIGEWIKDEYYLLKEFIFQYAAHKRSRKPGQPVKKPSTKTVRGVETQLPASQVAGALEKLGATSLTNCLVSGIAFAIASIGVFGDMG
jgi:hypothetical protein